MPSRRGARFRLKKPSASTGDVPRWTTAAVATDQWVRVDRFCESGTPRAAVPTKAAPAQEAPTKAAWSALATPASRIVCDVASEAIIKLMCLAAVQLLSLVGSVPKCTGVWIVLEAGDGSATAHLYGKIINCAGTLRQRRTRRGVVRTGGRLEGAEPVVGGVRRRKPPVTKQAVGRSPGTT